jgi:hypothetical protein
MNKFPLTTNETNDRLLLCQRRLDPSRNTPFKKHHVLFVKVWSVESVDTKACHRLSACMGRTLGTYRGELDIGSVMSSTLASFHFPEPSQSHGFNHTETARLRQSSSSKPIVTRIYAVSEQKTVFGLLQTFPELRGPCPSHDHRARCPRRRLSFHVPLGRPTAR